MSGLPSYLQSLEQVLGGSPVSSSDKTDSNSSSGTIAPTLPQLPTFFNMPQMNLPQQSNNSALKLLFVGTHAHQFTGYSKVTYGIMRVLSKLPWLQVTHFGFQKHPQLPPAYRPYPPNIRVIDAAELERRVTPPNAPLPQGFGYQILPDVIRQEKPDVVLIYNDMMVITKFLEEIRKSGIPRTFKTWLYVDQVYNTQPQPLLDIINRDADRVFAFTKYWKQCLKTQGINRPIDVIGHGFEKDMFTVLPKRDVRQKYGLPPDAFIISTLNRNQPRKRYDILIMAFVECISKYPTKPIFLMCVCDKGDKGGWWIHEIFHRELRLRNLPIEQFGNRIIMTMQDMIYRDEDINIMYNIGDIGISTADGEGWGLCNFEQMGVGIPQVVPDIGGFKEFCTSTNSMVVKPKYRMYQPTAYSIVGGEAEICDPHDICLGIEEYLLDSEKRRKHGEEAMKHVQSFTWEKVTETFVKRLKTQHDTKDEDDE